MSADIGPDKGTEPTHGDSADNTLRAWRTGIDTYQEFIQRHQKAMDNGGES